MKYEPRKGPLPKRNPQTGGGGTAVHNSSISIFKRVFYPHSHRDSTDSVLREPVVDYAGKHP